MIKVKLLNGDAYWMAFYADSDGNTWLDLDDNFEIKYSKEIETLTDIDKINVEAILGTSLIATTKNEALIGKPAKIGVFHNAYDDYDVQVCIGLKIFNQSKLRILSKKESLKPGDAPHYEIEIIDETKHWAVLLNKMYLDELGFTDFEYSPDNLWNSFNLKHKYQDGDEGYWFPLVNYGQWFSNRKYMVSDFRPWIHDLKVLQLAFKQAEWQFSCPLLESDLGRRLISYVLKEKFYTDEVELKFAEFKASYKADKLFNGGRKTVYAPVIFENELVDKSNSYDPTTGKFTATGKFKFVAEITADIVAHDGGFGGNRAYVVLQFIKVLANGTEIELGGDAKQEYLSTDYAEAGALITLETGEINLFAGESIYVRFSGRSRDIASARIKKGSLFYNEPIAKIFDTGDVLDFSKALRHDKVLDFLKGDAHLFNFKFYTDFAGKKVHILTPYDVNFFGDSLTGFFQDTLLDFTDYIDLTNTDIKVPQEEKKNLYYKFKETKDPFIEAFKLEKDSDIFSNFIDNGFDFEDETIKKENPYFEPTINNLEQTKGFLFDMPVCLDNLDGKLSFSINPRKLIAAGMVDQDNYYELDYFGTVEDNVAPYIGQYVTPYAYQLANAAVFNGTTYAKVDEYLIYGKDQFDLYNLFYKKYDNEFNNCHTISLETYANYDKIESIDFRKRVLVHINGTSQYGRFLSVNGYDPVKREGTILFKPDNTSDPVSSLYVVQNKCENYPDILITANGGGSYTISATGTYASPLATQVIQWRYFDTQTWTTGATFSTTSKRVYCRITWTFSDDCPNIVRVGTVEPCGNYPKVCAERSFPEPYTLNVYECGSHSDTIIGYLYEYSVNNISWQVIPDPFLLSDLPEKVWLRVTVYYTNCEPRTAELIYSNTASADDCTYDGLYVPSLAFATTPAGLIIERKGFFTGKVAADIIWVRKVGTDDEWDLYNDRNQEILDTNNGINWEAYRVVMFCNEDCPIYCSDVVTANNNCAGSVAIVDSSMLNDFEMKWENPDTPGSLTWKSVIANDESSFVPKIKVFVDQHDVGHTNILERSVEWHQWSFKTEFLWTWAQTDSVKLLKISKNVAGTQTLGLNLDLNVKFETGATNDELKTLLENAIFAKMFDQYGAINGTHYKLIVTITGSGSTRTAGVAFQAKKVITDTWFGPNATSDYLQTETVGHTTTNIASSKKEFQEVTTPAPTVTIWTPCGNPLTVKFKVNTSTQFVNDASSNFDNIVMNGTIAIVEEVITSTTDICQRHSLSLTITGCTSPTYVWKKGRKILGTASTITTYGNNIIKVIVGCNDNCYYKTEVIQ